jgi:peptidoglycan/LPS O-acetylase OafA/YrhL
MFFLGVLIYRTRAWSLRATAPLLTALQLLAIFVIAITFHYGMNDVWMTMPFALIVLATQTDRGAIAKILTARPLVRLGCWSYSIYMLHICVRYVLYAVWPKWVSEPLQLSAAGSGVALFATALVLTLVAGALSYAFFETPARIALRRALRDGK